jgi:hypothetical protein
LKQTGSDYSTSIGNAAMQKVAGKAARQQLIKALSLLRGLVMENRALRNPENEKDRSFRSRSLLLEKDSRVTIRSPNRSFIRRAWAACSHL